MTKIRRIERIVAITKLLVETPGTLFPLGYFCELFDLAKSSISEDLLTVKQAFDRFNLGVLETVAGASGGVRFIPQRSGEEQRRIFSELASRLAAPERIIP
ncbi:MAG: pur operon repressor, partial [Clostridiales bacterium]|nr:pur operon repressor [Clostridiales bacterium]